MYFTLVLLASVLGASQGDLLGKFVFNHGDEKNGASLSILHQPTSISFSANSGAIPAQEITNILALSMGFSINKDLSWNGLRAGNFFDRPNAVFMLNIDGVPAGSKLNLKASQKFPVTLSEDSSDLSQILRFSATSTLAEHVNELFDGKSTSRSVSSKKEVAFSGASNGDKTVSFWNEMQDSWQTIIDGEMKTTLTRKQILKRIEQVLPKEFIYNSENSRIEVNTKSVQTSFDLESQEDFNFISELVYSMFEISELALNKHAIKDGIPDVYTVSITTLKALERKYGEGSKQVQAAVLLLQNLIPQMVSELKKLYGGNILAVALTLDSDSSVVNEHKDSIDEVVAKVKSAASNVFGLDKEVHVAETIANDAKLRLCEAVRNSIIPNSIFKFKCAHQRTKRDINSDPTSADKLPGNVAFVYDEAFPVIFNIWFWLIVVLALALYAIAVAMWNMDPGRDSIIYRLTQQKIRTE